MNIKRKVLLCIYSLTLLVTCILRVPVYAVWGSEKSIHALKHAPIWKLMDPTHTVNGFKLLYELDIKRILLTFTVITIITFLLFFVLNDKENKTI